MLRLILICIFAACISFLPASEIHLKPDDCLFVKYPVPEIGIVCSNNGRALRLAKKLDAPNVHQDSWGSSVVIGRYQGVEVFIASAPVGTGSGLLFTELYANGAKYILRYGSDDMKSPPDSDRYLVKIVDEADNLYGFNLQSGVDPDEWGKSISASQKMVKVLVSTAEESGVLYEMRICHHLENYHAIRNPNRFSFERRKRLIAIVDQLGDNPKPSSWDMETAVLFRVAKDFDLHAATILQTVNKESHRTNGYEGENLKQTLEIEENIFFDFVLGALLKVSL